MADLRVPYPFPVSIYRSGCYTHEGTEPWRVVRWQREFMRVQDRLYDVCASESESWRVLALRLFDKRVGRV